MKLRGDPSTGNLELITKVKYDGPFTYLPLKFEPSFCHCVWAGFSESPSKVAYHRFEWTLHGGKSGGRAYM
jgi:hypothetical protein